MSNSPLVVYTKISPNKTINRKNNIDRITPHCVVGQCSVETLGNIFAPESRKASCNYGIGADGRIGMYCEEKDRSWCTSSSANDNRAVTIECASDAKHPYAFKDIVYERLIELCVDICKRNGKTKLLWLGDKDKTLNYKPASDEMVLTVHRWFANKSCPGEWMYSRMGDLADKVTAQLTTTVEPKPEEPVAPAEPKPEEVTIKKGDIVKIADDATYYSGKKIPGWVKNQNWIVKNNPVGDRAIIDKNEAGTNSINSPISTKYLTVVKSPFKPYLVRVSISDLNMRTGPSTSYPRIGYIPKGVFTIVEENGKWGRLKARQAYNGKSVAAWIHLGYTTKV